MHIPQEFQLGGITWKVEAVPLLPVHLGECDSMTATIKLDPTPAQQFKEQTFCHELVHAIMYSMGYHTKPHDETFVDGFATMLHQFLNTNK
jgi:hypothetical protein